MLIKRRKNYLLLLAAFFAFSCDDGVTQGDKPNIIIIYADDLGYGDLSCYGATSVQTFHIDKLAENGLRLLDAHSTASTCTPSRFSLLTGSYAFRNNAAILPGDAPLLIRPNTPTLPRMLQRSGYRTAVIGKWHLGLGDGVLNWNEEIKPGPLEVGFDYSFIIPATQDRVPTVFIENDRVANLDPSDPIEVNYVDKVGNWPTGLERPDLLKFGADTQHSNTITDSISRIGYMTGGESALWKDQEIAPTLIQKVNTFITESKSQPFFLFFSFTDIHVPRDPHKMFKGKTAMGPRGDAILQMDWSVGELMNILKEHHLEKNTLIIFTSDNGPVTDDGYVDYAEELLGEHDPSGGFKGGKYSAHEAGTRMPTIIYWYEKVQKGVSDALISQADLYASLAKLVGYPLQSNEAPDSYEMLGVLLGKDKKGREDLLQESFTIGLREANWKYIAAQTTEAPVWLKNKNVATGLSKQPQLYNLENDSEEENDLSSQLPEKVWAMQQRLEKMLSSPTRKGYKD